MTTMEILQRVAENHNRIARVTVSGDNAVLIGDTIRDLRLLAAELQEQAEAEQKAEAEAQEIPEEVTQEK